MTDHTDKRLETIWVIEVTWKRRKGQPREAIAMTTGGVFHAMCFAKECADKMKVPQSWIDFVRYERSKRQVRSHGMSRNVKEGK